MNAISDNRCKLLTKYKVLIVFIFSSTIIGLSTAHGQKKKSVYFWLLKQCNQEVFTKTFEYPFLAILDDHLKERYKHYTTLEEKKSFIHYYWNQNNPNPLADENEYLQEFIRRCHYVEQYYTQTETPYFDDRGKYFLKYGEPFIRYTQEAQTKYVDFFREDMQDPFQETDNELADKVDRGGYITVKRFLGKMIGKGVEAYQYLPLTYTIKGNESWVYQFIQNGRLEELIVHFADEGSYFREVESLDEVIIQPHKVRVRYFYWADLLKDRANALQSQTIFRTYENILNFEAEIKSAGDKGIKYFPFYSSGYDIMNPHNKFMNINNTLTSDLTNNKNNVPINVLTTEKVIQQLFFHYDITQFRGSDDETVLVINCFTPFSENFTDKNQPLETDSISLLCSSLFEDQMLERVIEKNCLYTYDLKKFGSIDFPYFIGNMQISLLPRPGRVSLQVLDKVTQRRGFIKRKMNLRDFSTGDLCLSDIQFCQQIEDSLYRDLAPVRDLRGISVIPYPYEKIHPDEQLFCYFEIYNIKTGGIQSQYEVSIEVTTAKQGSGLLKKATGIFRKSTENSISIHHIRDVMEDDSKELIGIDFTNLDKGDYTLTIKVKDIDDQSISAAVKRSLHIVK